MVQPCRHGGAGAYRGGLFACRARILDRSCRYDSVRRAILSSRAHFLACRRCGLLSDCECAVDDLVRLTRATLVAADESELIKAFGDQGGALRPALPPCTCVASCQQCLCRRMAALAAQPSGCSAGSTCSLMASAASNHPFGGHAGLAASQIFISRVVVASQPVYHDFLAVASRRPAGADRAERAVCVKRH